MTEQLSNSDPTLYTLDLKNICHYIESSIPKNITFVSIGGAHNGRNVNSGSNHQFPQFVIDLMTMYSTNSPSYRLILIDPLDNLWTDHTSYLSEPIVFTNSKYKNILISPSIELIHIKQSIDIKLDIDFFAKLNKSHMKNVKNYLNQSFQMVLMFVHCFTGADINPLKHCIATIDNDPSVKDHILYNLTMTSDFGCFPNLMNNSYKPIIILDYKKQYIIFDVCRLDNTEICHLIKFGQIDNINKIGSFDLDENFRYKLRLIAKSRIDHFISVDMCLYRQIGLEELSIIQRLALIEPIKPYDSLWTDIIKCSETFDDCETTTIRISNLNQTMKILFLIQLKEILNLSMKKNY
jgi:hypothetical protein